MFRSLLLPLFFFSIIGTSLASEAGFYFHAPAKPVSGLAALFVVLHGFSSSAEDISNISRFSEIADQRGFYVLYPEYDDPNDWTKCWQYFLPEEQRPGQGSAQQIVDEVQRILVNYPIDRSRIYLAGMSAGASMGSILTACYPALFNGVALHSGTAYGLSSTWKEALVDLRAGPSVYRPTNRFCRPSAFKGKLMLFQGTLDEVVHPLHLDRLTRDFLGATLESKIDVPESDSTLGYLQRDYRRQGLVVGKTFLIQGQTHAWSGSAADGPKNTPPKVGPDATSQIVDFFLEGSRDQGKDSQ